MKLLLIIPLVFISFYAVSQKNSDDKKRAEAIFAISKYITWPNDANIDTFKIAVLDPNYYLETELKKFAETSPLLHKKPIKVIRFSNIEDINNCTTLFANNDNGFDIDKILKKLSGKHTLLVTENYPFHKSMVNYILVKGVRRYELNDSKLKEEGFTANELFVAGAVKSQADWESLYKQTDVQLQKEKEIVEAQSIEIEKQKKEIAEQTEKIAKQREEIALQIQQIEKQKTELFKVMSQVGAQQKLLKLKIEELNTKERELISKNDEISKKSKVLEEQQTSIAEQESKISEQKKVLNEQLAKIEMQQLILYLFIAIILLITVMGYFIFKAYKVKKRANKLLKEKNFEIMEQNEEIRQQKEEIEAQRDEIEKQNAELEIQKKTAEDQRDEITEQKEEIMASIHYARRIQTAVLPPSKFISKILPDHFFILNKPRDIVSGDYYWMAQKGNKTIIAAADCTGHGVPGAFMSLLGVSFLNEVINKMDEIYANNILDKLRESVINALNQAGTEGITKDGMDLALCVLDLNTYELQFAGANNPLYLIRNKELIETKADKMPIGLYDENKPFTNNLFQLQKDDAFYIFSDGYPDQFGGPSGKKFMYKKMKELLVNIQDEKMSDQQKILEKTIEDWQGDLFQVDDMLIIGVKV
ncbi:MAG: DUF4154 domain-containing protein [Bacteroidia bacterium]|nr:DUF4154 domain-containing protein [Bacteroidia bacterium]